MLLNPKASQSTKITIVPGEVHMSIPETRHERAAFAQNDSDIGVFLQVVDVWNIADVLDTPA